MAKQKAKKARNEEQKHRTVYFNINKIHDEVLYKFTQDINFSAFVKGLIHQEMVRRGGVAPSPYENLANVTPESANRTIPVQVRQPSTVVTPNTAGVSINVNGKTIEPKAVEEDLDEVIEDEVIEDEIIEDDADIEEEIDDETEVEETVEEEEDIEESSSEESPEDRRRGAAAAFANRFKRT